MSNCLYAESSSKLKGKPPKFLSEKMMEISTLPNVTSYISGVNDVCRLFKVSETIITVSVMFIFDRLTVTSWTDNVFTILLFRFEFNFVFLIAIEQLSLPSTKKTSSIVSHDTGFNKQRSIAYNWY